LLGISSAKGLGLDGCPLAASDRGMVGEGLEEALQFVAWKVGLSLTLEEDARAKAIAKTRSIRLKDDKIDSMVKGMVFLF